VWVITTVVIAFAWVSAYALSRRFVYVGDRFEVAVLKPLTATYGMLAVQCALDRAWVLSGLFGAGCLVTAMMGTARHPGKTFGELAEGTERGMLKGPAKDPEYAERRPVGRQSCTLVRSNSGGAAGHYRVPRHVAFIVQRRAREQA
jgi:hypothetical protein